MPVTHVVDLVEGEENADLGRWRRDLGRPARLDSRTTTTRKLQRDYLGLHRLDWAEPADPSVEFDLPISEWFALFRRTGFVVEDFFELRAPTTATGEQFGVDADWARRYPSEPAWRLRKIT